MTLIKSYLRFYLIVNFINFLGSKIVEILILKEV